MKKAEKYFILDNPIETKYKQRMKECYYFFLCVWYRLKMLAMRVEVKEKKYNTSICAIFKNEAPYLREWIEFNHIVGVDHFYLYNNNSEDEYLGVLKPYIDKGLVTLIEWPYSQMQMECYKACIARFAQETKWLGFIDIDEFIIPKSTDSVYDFLKTFENKAGAVNIYWRLFGTSGKLNRDLKGLVCEDFTVCWPKHCDIGKCFYNTAYGFNPSSKHSSQLHHKFWANIKGADVPPVNVFNKICIGTRNVAKSGEFPIQINHYFTKSYKEYAMKGAKGDVYFKINPHDENYFYEHELKCTSTDYSAYKYLIQLKLRMEDEKNDKI